MVGKRMTTGAVLDELEKDRMFYETSGGGVTVSGGEPLAQPLFVQALLKECKERGFHTALETSGLGTWDALSGLVDYLDLAFYDVKHLDSGKHKELTGVDNGLILENLQKLSTQFSPIIVRIPLVPGVNDSREDQMQMYRFVSRLVSIAWIEIMPYHRLGLTKYEGLGRTYDLASLPSLNKRELSHLVDLGKEVGLEVRIGST
jgi:pyruvate formate lyase activating enzyme